MLLPKSFMDALNLGGLFGTDYTAEGSVWPKVVAVGVFLVLALVLLRVGSRKTPVDTGMDAP
jgi:hypothetical protein